MNDRCVLFYGDSFVNGAGDEEGLGWTGRLVAAAWEAGMPLTAYNLGVRGENTGDVAKRFKAEAESRLIPDADNRAVIAVGANDVAIDTDGEQELSPDQSVELMTQMLGEARELGITVMVLGPGPAGIEDHDARSRALGRRFEQLCGERGHRYVNVLDDLLESKAWRKAVKERDGIHPDSRGYEALADLVLEAGWLEWLAAAP